MRTRVISQHAEPAGGRIRVLRVIARLNMGGPAHHVGILTAGLDRDRYETLLAAGDVGPGEAPLRDLHGAEPHRIRGLSPRIRPLSDFRALVQLVRLVRSQRPDIVHTHTAKAGMLGRMAALAAPRGRRPIVIHTYHGHVLEGYFGRALTAFYRMLERALGGRSDVLIGVSQATVDDLVRLRIAPRERFRAIPLGLELDRFLSLPPAPGGSLREELGVASDETLFVSVGRLVAIKRMDVALRAVALARGGGARARLAIVGDGELRSELEALAAQLGLAEAVSFLGYRDDLEEIARAADAALLSSENEGTPVALIEAAAAARPAVATRVGGVTEVVPAGHGIVVQAGDVDALARAISELASAPAMRRQMGERARAHVRERYAADRLLADVDDLYQELLARR